MDTQTDNPSTIDISNLVNQIPQGYYLIKIETSTFTATRTLILN